MTILGSPGRLLGDRVSRCLGGGGLRPGHLLHEGPEEVHLGVRLDGGGQVGGGQGPAISAVQETLYTVQRHLEGKKDLPRPPEVGHIPSASEKLGMRTRLVLLGSVQCAVVWSLLFSLVIIQV